MYRRIINLSKSRSFFLFGARGTGKTTLLTRQIDLKNAVIFSLLDPLLEDELRQNPMALKQKIEAMIPAPKQVIVDEIQKVPQLLDVIQMMMIDKKYQFILTGSSARKLKRGSANLLAGRANLSYLYPFTHVELGADFNLEFTLKYGSLPEIFSIKEDKEIINYLKSYVTTFIKEEIRAEQIVRRIDPFRKFLSVVAECNTEIVNFSNIGRQCGVDYKSVQNYFEILEDTLVGYLLEAFSEKIRQRQLKAPKFYFFDIGVARVLNENMNFGSPTEGCDRGKLFEHFIILEILRLNSYYMTDFKLSYLKTTNGTEIDLILKSNDKKYIFIEIKHTNRISEQDHLKNLKIIREDYPKATFMVLCQEDSARLIDGIKIMPWQQGIKEIFADNTPVK